MKNKKTLLLKKNNEEHKNLAVRGRCNAIVKEQKCAINTDEGVLGCHVVCNPRPEGRKVPAVQGAAPSAALALSPGVRSLRCFYSHYTWRWVQTDERHPRVLVWSFGVNLGPVSSKRSHVWLIRHYPFTRAFVKAQASCKTTLIFRSFV